MQDEKTYLAVEGSNSDDNQTSTENKSKHDAVHCCFYRSSYRISKP
nr:hypothetical protein [Legionella waltersii]